MRIKKNINLGIIGWFNIVNSLNYHDKNCMVDSKENYKFDQGVKGLNLISLLEYEENSCWIKVCLVN